MERQPQREYDDDNRCNECGAHIAEPHSPGCSRSDDLEHEAVTEPREVWVADLAAYNNGSLHGLWIDMTQDAEEIREQIAYLLSRSPEPGAEEYAFFDYSGFHGLQRELGEYPGIELTHEIAVALDEHGEAMAEWLKCVGFKPDDVGDMIRQFDDHYLGKWDTVKDFVQHYLSESGLYEELDRALSIFPDNIRGYVVFDEDQYARDMELELFVAEAEDGGVFIFDTTR